ncbi:thioredoxin reductase [Xylariaceae sp. FL0255]|nr:thioredoxin reductase [Xylariaceae sp. FL0255]
MSELSDVLIIGGGHAGLSAALTTYRALLKTTIFDTQEPRNSWNTEIHLMPTWDSKTLSENLAASRRELEKTGLVDFVNARIQSVEKMVDGTFKATDATGKQWIGRKVLLAFGSSNVFPSIPGYAESFARNIYPCMFQFGFERRGVASAGLLAVDDLASVFAASTLADDGHRFTDDFTIYTDGNPSLAAELKDQVSDHGIHVEVKKIAGLRSEPSKDGVMIDFEDGSSRWQGFLVHRPGSDCTSDIVQQLGLETAPLAGVKVSMPFCQTNVPGVFAAGDCASMMRIIPHAVAMGAYAGCGIARELPRRDTGNACTI